MKAQMGLFANLTGQTMGAFGSVGNVALPQTTDMMNQLYNTMYTKKPITAAEKEDSRTDVLAQAQKKLSSEQLAQFKSVFSDKQAFSNSANILRQPVSADQMKEAGKKLIDTITDPENRRRIQQHFEEALTGGKNTAKHLEKLVEVDKEAFKDKSDPKKVEQFQGTQKALDEIVRVMRSEHDEKKMLTKTQEIIATLPEEDRKKVSRQVDKALEQGAEEMADRFEKSTGADRDMLSIVDKGSRHFNFMEQTTQTKGFDFTATRGFKIEDLTEGFTRAADLRLVGKKPLNESFDQYLKNTPKVLDAARSLFGTDKSGSELVTDVDELLGSSFVDMTDTKGSHELEKLLRDVKGAARTAGISIEAIKGIIQQGKMLAQSNPELAQMGGIDIAKMAIRSTHQATALGAFFGGDYIRRAGGVVGITESIMAGEVMNRQEPISRELAAITEFFGQQGKQEAVDSVAKYARDPEADHTQVGLNRFINKIAQENNVKPAFLHSFASSAGETIIESGFRRTTDLQKVANSSYEQQLMREAAIRMTPEDFATFNRAIEGTGEFKDKPVSPNELVSMGSRMGLIGGTTQKYLQEGLNTGKILDMQIRRNPELKKLNAVIEAKTDRDTKLETKMSEKMAFLNAPPVTAIFNQLMSGEVDKKGISALWEPLQNNTNFVEIKNITDKMLELGLVNDKNIHSFFNKEGAKVDGKEMKQLMDSGLTTEQIRSFAGEDGDKKYQRALSKDPTNKALLALGNGAGFKTNTDRLVSTLNKIDPRNQMTGKTDFESLVKSKMTGLKDDYTTAAAKDVVQDYDKSFQSFFSEARHQTGKTGEDANKLFELAKEFKLTDKDDSLNITKFLTSASDEKFKKAAEKKGISKDSLDSFVRTASETKEKMDYVKHAGEKQAANDEMGVTLKKILDSIGGSNGQNLVSVLSTIADGLRDAMKTQ